jgi:DNA-directed RNA polymerase specialized sigma subunit
VLFEQMLCRDGLTFEEAVGTLQVDHQCSVTREELHAIYQQLPMRSARRFATEEELAVARVKVGTTDHALDHRHDLEIAERVERALVDAVGELSTPDQLVLKFRFADGLSIPDIGRLLHIPPKRIYRQLHQIVALLRQRLLERGVEANDIERVVGHPALTLGRVFSSDGAIAGELGTESV